ncbi:hypothetical protein ABPG74_006939 [Tetrahymena malaccensis]
MIKSLASILFILAIQIQQYSCSCPQISRSLEDLSNNFRSVLGRHIPSSQFHYIVYMIHFAFAFIAAIMLTIQWATKKGSSFHKSFGIFMKYVMLPLVITGLLLTYFLNTNKSIVNLMKSLGGIAMTGYSACIFSSFFATFMPTKNYIYTSIQILFSSISLYLWMTGQYMLLMSIIQNEMFSFDWENNIEIFVSLFLNGFNQAVNIYFLFTRGPSIQWKSHHIRNSIDFTQMSFQGTMYVVGRDGYWFFAHPGLSNIWIRIFIQNILQWSFIAYNLGKYKRTFQSIKKEIRSES